MANYYEAKINAIDKKIRAAERTTDIKDSSGIQRITTWRTGKRDLEKIATEILKIEKEIHGLKQDEVELRKKIQDVDRRITNSNAKIRDMKAGHAIVEKDIAINKAKAKTTAQQKAFVAEVKRLDGVWKNLGKELQYEQKMNAKGCANKKEWTSEHKSVVKRLDTLDKMSQKQRNSFENKWDGLPY